MLKALGSFLGKVLRSEDAAMSDGDENRDPVKKRNNPQCSNTISPRRVRTPQKRPALLEADIKIEAPRGETPPTTPRLSHRSKAPVERLSLTFHRPSVKRRLSHNDDRVKKVKTTTDRARSLSVKAKTLVVVEDVVVERKKKKASGKKTLVKNSVVETERPERGEKEELLPDDVEEEEAKKPKEDAPMSKIIVVCSEHDHESTSDIIYMKKFQASIPPSCKEAIRAQKHGSLEIKFDFPGIPTRKFALSDVEKFGSSASDWPVQAIYDTGDDRLMVHYEGWSCQTISWQTLGDFAGTAPEMLSDSRIKKLFMRALRERISEKEVVDFVEHWPNNKKKEPLHLYWLYEDMTYFHSILNKEAGFAPIFYMSCSKNNVKPPYYAYTPVNLIECRALERCKKSRANNPFKGLKDTRIFGYRPDNVCERPETCQCDKLYGLLYASPLTQCLKYLPDSTIDFSDFDSNRQRLVVECSDACGCSASCPRRALQRGQQIPLVVYFESKEKGFGLRAAANIKKGSLVCEYTGEILLLPEKEWVHWEDDEDELKKSPKRKELVSPGSKEEEPVKDTSYEAVFSFLDDRLAICALTKGNVARFINHSCSPSTVFAEVYSRRSPKDTLIPRIAVYATKDIAIGEEITVAYWTAREQSAFGKTSTVTCHCGSKECCGTLRGK